MNKILLTCFLLIYQLSWCLADKQDYITVINKQSEQIKNLTIRLETLENTVFDLKNQLQVQGQQVSSGAPLNLAATKDSRLIGSGPSLNKEESEEMIASVRSSGRQEKKDYDIALATLKEGKLEEAERLFYKFIEDYPGSSLQSNAAFWYSETFYRRGIFNQAAVNYLKGYKANPKGVKAADSLLKLAYALAALNKHQEACSMLDKLNKEFPDRPSTGASDARSKFGCK